MVVLNKTRILPATFLAAAIAGSLYSVCPSNSNVEVHYAPGENLESIDANLIDSARTKIDMAAYVLSNDRILRALEKAIEKGVKVNVIVDCREINKMSVIVLNDGNVWSPEIACNHDLMHMKSYAIDGKVLRTGSANFSYPGLHRQNNDLVIIRDQKVVDYFEEQFLRLQ